MLVYHCKVIIASDMVEIMSFNLTHLAMLFTIGWLPMETACLPGAFI